MPKLLLQMDLMDCGLKAPSLVLFSPFSDDTESLKWLVQVQHTCYRHVISWNEPYPSRNTPIYCSQHTVSPNIFINDSKEIQNFRFFTSDNLWRVYDDTKLKKYLLLKSSSNGLYFYTLMIPIRAMINTSILHFYRWFHPGFPNSVANANGLCVTVHH